MPFITEPVAHHETAFLLPVLSDADRILPGIDTHESGRGRKRYLLT